MTIRILSSVIILSLATTGCFLAPKKKSGDGDGSRGDKYIVQNSIFIDRLGTGETARVKFRTLHKTFCRIELYSQDESRAPKKDQPREIDCQGSEAREDFVVRIDDLATDDLYYFLLSVRAGKDDAAPLETLLVKETPFTPGEDGEDPTPADGKFRGLYVGRLNIPLKTAEVHRHKLAEPLDLAGIRAKLTPKLGCITGVPSAPGPFNAAEKDINIDKLATTSFAAAVAKKHPDYPGIRQLTYAGVNAGLDQWKFLYASAGKDIEMTARSGNTLETVELASTAKTPLVSGQLATDVAALGVDTSKDLSVSWTTSANLLEHAYVTVQIGRPGYGKAIFCTFKAKDKKAAVPASQLAELDAGKHVVQVQLESTQLIASKGWLLTTYDWRSGRVEKL